MKSASKQTQGKRLNRSFAERCYALLTQVPKGRVTTYQELAHALGGKAYRAVGTAMKLNTNAPKVPCHRVVKSDGTLGGYALGAKKKREILRRERIKIEGDKIIDLKKILWNRSRFRK
ncbi:MAG: cysteine methyltransferase [Proteobacteria bacterium]|nr:MAG: cysteine methyltransferase [Pseudomonadota bacterium]